MNRKPLAIVILCLALLTAPLGVAASSAGPGAEERADKWVLENDAVTVWFQEKKPLLNVFPGDDETAGYAYGVDRLVEYRDDDGDGHPDAGEVRAYANLAGADDWRVTENVTGERATLAFQRDAPVTVRAPLVDQEIKVPGDRTVANVTLTFHLFGAATTVPGPGNVTVPVDVAAVKYDLAVDGWPWVDAENGRLALVVDVGGAVSPLDGAPEGVPAAGVDVNGTRTGVLTWLTTAQAASADGENVTDVDVNATFEALENGTRMAFTFDGSGYGRLQYDPTVGLAPSDGVLDEGARQTDGLQVVPAAGVVPALGVAAMAALLVGRRRRLS